MRRAGMLGVIGLALSLGASAQEPAPGAGGDATNGRQAFENHGCYQCHGLEAHGGAAPRLAPDPLPFARFSRYVRAPTGQMPPYTSRILSEPDLRDIFAFVASIPAPPPVESIPLLNED